MATYNNIKKIKIGDNIFNLYDSGNSGGTVTSVATGAGLTGGSITGSGTIKANLNSETSLGTIGTTSKLYAVGVDENGELCVNVPWTNTDTQAYSKVVTDATTFYLIGDEYDFSRNGQFDKHKAIRGSVASDSSTNGIAQISLGNNKASGTAGSKYGALTLYGTTTYYGRIISGSPTASRTVELPDASGTIALTSDIPTNVSELTNDSGFTTNTGTVTSITLTQGDGISIGSSGTAITSSGTRTIALSTSGATAGSYGPSANASPSHGGTFSVPYVTVDEYGRVTSISTKTITLPADSNTDTKVTISALTKPSTATAYAIPFSTSYAHTSSLYSDSSIHVTITGGTASAQGNTDLVLGNYTASGTAENQRGRLYLYSTSTGGAYLQQAENTGSLTHTFPATSGTLINTAGGQTINGSTTICDTVKIHRETTTADNEPAGLVFTVKNNTTNQQYTSLIDVYNDNASTSYGNNMVISPRGAMFLGSGEAAEHHYSAKGSVTSEYMYITADDRVLIQSNGNTIANRNGFLLTADHYLVPCVADEATDYAGHIGSTNYMVQTICGAYIWAGKFSANTAQAREYQIGAQGGAGRIYLYSHASTTGTVGIYGKNAANENLPIISVAQDNSIALGSDTRIVGSLKVENHSSPIGTVKESHLTAAKSVPTGTSTGTPLCSISLEAGTWVLTCWVRPPNNATGYRAANISTSNTDAGWMASSPGGSSSQQLVFSYILELTATKTYYLNAIQNSGSALTYPAGTAAGMNGIRAVRIA